MMDFSGRAALVTGAGGGIGAAVGRLFHEAGAGVVLADRRVDAVQGLVRKLDPAGERAIAMDYDAAVPRDADDAIAMCIETFGRLDFLVPAAAVFEHHALPDMTDEDWRRTLCINLDGVFHACRRAAAVMDDDGAAIVMLASEAAHAGSSPGYCDYGASKGGVLALTRSLARELAPRVRVNAVSPGTIDTPMVEDFTREHGGHFVDAIPMRRLGTPREVVDAVAFLCSAGASYITGQAIHVNGGSYMGG